MKPGPFLFEDPVFRRVAGKTLRPGGLELTRRGLAQCAWPAGAAVADIGCGAGATLGLLTELGYDARGFDLSPNLVAEAAAATSRPVGVADAAALPLADGEVDGVVCECLLTLLPDPEKALSEIFRVLAPGGGLFLADVTRRDPRPAGGNAPTAAARSCLAGAMTVDEGTRRLERHGFAVRAVDDYPDTIKSLAVQLLWQGKGLCEFSSWLGLSCCGMPKERFSYSHWIAMKPNGEKR